MLHGDVLYTGDAGVPIGHYVPYELNGRLYEAVYSELKKCITALELNNCAINVDYIRREDKVFVLEVGARAGATGLSELVSVYYCIDFYRYLLELSLGANPKFNPKQKLTPCASMLLMANQDGKISSFNKVSITGNILEASLDYSIGDPVRKFNVGPDRIGQVIVKGDSVSSMMNEIRHITNQLNVQIKE